MSFLLTSNSFCTIRDSNTCEHSNFLLWGRKGSILFIRRITCKSGNLLTQGVKSDKIYYLLKGKVSIIKNGKKVFEL